MEKCEDNTTYDVQYSTYDNVSKTYSLQNSIFGQVPITIFKEEIQRGETKDDIKVEVKDKYNIKIDTKTIEETPRYDISIKLKIPSAEYSTESTILSFRYESKTLTKCFYLMEGDQKIGFSKGFYDAKALKENGVFEKRKRCQCDVKPLSKDKSKGYYH